MIPAPLASALSTAPNAGVPAGFGKRPKTEDEKKTGAGVLFVTPNGDALFLRRQNGDHPGEWCIPGGMVEDEEEAIDAARRETLEEIGNLPKWELAAINRETTDRGVDFSTFGQMVDDRFDPTLNHEHDEYMWAPLTDPPSPLHPGLKSTLDKLLEPEPRERPEPAQDDGTPKTLYASRPVQNAKDIIEWAKGAGFKKRMLLHPDDLRVVVAFSNDQITWPERETAGLVIPKAGSRTIEDTEDGIALYFDSSELIRRWWGLRAMGASWDYAKSPPYRPCVVFATGNSGLTLSELEPYDGELRLGGEEFNKTIDPADASRRPDFSAGIMYLKGDKVLLLRRASFGVHHPGEWDFPGGGVEGSEDVEQAARREAKEETGAAIARPMRELIKAQVDGTNYTCFLMELEKRFKPALNDEHVDWKWFELDDLPRPVHPGVYAAVSRVLEEREHQAADTDMDQFGARAVEKLQGGFPVKGELQGRNHPPQPNAGPTLSTLGTDSAVKLAFDRESVRSFDKDGRLRVAVTNISKANISPYKGAEIPEWEKLGLDPERVYQMLRDPEELKKSVPTWNGIQLLRQHVPVDAEDHRQYEIIGTTGTNSDFDGTYLRNSLVIWSKEGIGLVESGQQKELSCGYHYRADMTPGEFNGRPYDGVMRDIAGNHVALVEEGRVGHDVVVADSMDQILWARIAEALDAAWAV